MRISDWSSDVCSSDLTYGGLPALLSGAPAPVDLTLEAGGARVTAKGTAGELAGAVTADLAVTASGQEIAALSTRVGTVLPSLGPYQLSGNIKGVQPSLDLQWQSVA